MRNLILAAMAFTLSVGNVAAQTQNIDKFVITGEAAKRALTKTEISGETAAKIVQVCLDFAKEHNIAVSVFVLSPNGQIVHAHRMDGQTPIAIETGMKKAQTALYVKDSTHVLANRAANNVGQLIRYPMLGVLPVSGGLPIVVNDQLIGAIGVGGSNMDEECAYAGLTAVLGPQPPLAPRLPAEGARGQAPQR